MEVMAAQRLKEQRDYGLSPTAYSRLQFNRPSVNPDELARFNQAFARRLDQIVEDPDNGIGLLEVDKYLKSDSMKDLGLYYNRVKRRDGPRKWYKLGGRKKIERGEVGRA